MNDFETKKWGWKVAWCDANGHNLGKEESWAKAEQAWSTRSRTVQQEGYNSFPKPTAECPYTNDLDIQDWMIGWNTAAHDKAVEDLEQKQYEEMRDWFERWEYLKSKYGGGLR